MQYTNNTENEQTHLSFNKGKYNIPDNEYNNFYKKYYEAIINNEELFLIEKVYNSKFAFFIDIDNKVEDNLDDKNVLEIIKIAQNVIKEMFETSCNSFIISKRGKNEEGGNYHINFYDLIVDSAIAKKLITTILDKLENNKLKTCIDTSVYRTGLRLLGSKKSDKLMQKKNEKSDKNTEYIYKIYDLETKNYTMIKDTTFDIFMKTIVRRKKNIELTKLNEKYKSVVKIQNKSIPVKGVENGQIVEELSKLLNELKMTNECLQNFDVTIQRIYASQNKTGIFCYYVSVDEKFCPFKEREHIRPVSPIYFEISINGIYIKCYDEECLRRRYPDGGFKLPSNFATEYAQLYLSMTTKYWKSEINITDDIKTYLEDSLSGSHYKIAKAVFQIYKDRFRVDDIKNTEWYEFDSIRWKKSHLINILISEELPKYYRGIKVSDTSVKSNDLQDFLVNNEKVDANVRNQMVDNIIAKLENVSFKGNIISQVIFLFKTYDDEFYKNLDSKPHLVGFKNGVYDYEMGKFRDGTQDDCITFSTGYEYIEYDDKSKHVNDIYNFLSQIIPNQKVREYTLKVLGKALLGVPDERFYIWTGLSGANGKSTLVNFLENTLGDYITSVDVSLLTNKRGSSSNASPDVVRLRGKRIFTFQEPEHDDKLRTGILKQYTGGDTIIARELFKAPISFKLQGTMIMCCNDLPSVSSCDGGTWRRIRVIEFKSRFCDNPIKDNEFKIDPSIKYKIKEWRPYFMSILIHWYNKFVKEGMNEPDEVKKATAKYKVDNDKFNEFFDQVLEECKDTFEQNKNIYSNFSGWWSNNYPNARIPDIKDLIRSMKIKYGNEKESVVNGCIQYGFNIKFKYSLFDQDISDNSDDDL